MGTRASSKSYIEIEPTNILHKWWKAYQSVDPRIPVAGILFFYLILGLTVLGFNRTPVQAIVTTLSCVSLEMGLTFLFKRKWIFPLSALITSFSLSFLLNYTHDYFLLFAPLYFAIGSKYLIQFDGRHRLNPAMVGVTFSLLFTDGLITAAPAYQWNGIAALSSFIVMLGLIFVIPKVNRHWLVLSFLFWFTLQTALRSWIMRHHLPFETLFLGTLTSPSFFIFSFFMITDPPTSPPGVKQQLLVGFALATIDLLLHIKQSYFTFFYAALIVQTSIFSYRHFKALKSEGWSEYWSKRFLQSKYYFKFLTIALIGLGGLGFYKGVVHAHLNTSQLPFYLERIPGGVSGLDAAEKGDLWDQTDPRIHHVIKWIFSVGESVSFADVNNDGKIDLFLSNMLKLSEERAQLYLSDGDFHFKKFPLPELDSIRFQPKSEGFVTNATFIDYDNDGDQDLFVSVAFGSNYLLKNLLVENGQLSFIDVTEELGLTTYGVSIGASFADFNRDGRLDLFVYNVLPENLPDYETPTRFNAFSLPQPEYEGDERMFHFMHNSWHLSNNGGRNYIYLQSSDGKFLKQENNRFAFPETRWSLAVGLADFNKDGWTDIYVANDFGPDDLYYNLQGRGFENYKGEIFGSIGRDTYKGMNTSVADLDRKGWLNIYISNVHHPLQAEGSLLWSFIPNGTSYPDTKEEASFKGVLNENRFGWGASTTDFDNDGWVDIAQANGMVDDRFDKKFEECPDYWYVNEKIARSPPSIHSYANKWGDIRGYCIFGKERNRLYLNLGYPHRPQFVDVAEHIGMTELTNSRGVASVDLNNNGRRDMMFSHLYQPPTLYRNHAQGETSNSWLGLELSSLDSRCNREAIGSQVTLKVKTKEGAYWSITQEQQVVSGFSSQSDKRLHFGLGPNAESVSVSILWCGQFVREYKNLDVNQYIKLVFP
ncbi:MAG: VCBS repeat-containing protein [Bdellovibrionales bacterium]|nr:VCBS repeat-containing protein [Bdellovibrionales bacterium]